MVGVIALAHVWDFIKGYGGDGAESNSGGLLTTLSLWFWNSFIVGSIFGALLTVAIQWIFVADGLLDRALCRKTPIQMNVYVNFLVCNKGEIVERAMRKKLGRMSFFGSLASGLVASAVSDATVTRKIASELAAAVPRTMKSKGVHASGHVDFVRAAVGVVRLRIVDIDADDLLRDRLGDRAVGCLCRMARVCGMGRRARDALRSAAFHVVEARMKATLAGILSRTLRDQHGVDAQVVVRLEADQAPFFFKLIRSVKKDGKKTGPATSPKSAPSKPKPNTDALDAAWPRRRNPENKKAAKMDDSTWTRMLVSSVSAKPAAKPAQVADKPKNKADSYWAT